MIGMKPMAMILCLAVGLATLPAPLEAAGPPAPQDYARREADSPGLEEFRGGFHGVLFAFIVIAAVVGCCAIFVVDCPHCHHHVELPPAEGRRGSLP